jgi:hypothetical protein
MGDPIGYARVSTRQRYYIATKRLSPKKQRRFVSATVRWLVPVRFGRHGREHVRVRVAPEFGFQTVNDPKGVGSTTVNWINDHGHIVGLYVDASGNTDGFVGTPKGSEHPYPLKH